MRRAGVLPALRVGCGLLVGCGARGAAPEPPSAPPLELVVLDDYKTHDACEGIAPHRLEVTLDGAPAATIEVPCSTRPHVPPRAITRPLALAPGEYVLRVRDGAAVADLELVWPSDEGDKLVIWASDDELEIQGLRAAVE